MEIISREGPKVRELNPNNIPKRPEEKLPDFFSMSNEQLVAVMVASLCVKFDTFKYDHDKTYKAQIDQKILKGSMATTLLKLRELGVNVEKFIVDVNILAKTTPVKNEV